MKRWYYRVEYLGSALLLALAIVITEARSNPTTIGGHCNYAPTRCSERLKIASFLAMIKKPKPSSPF